MPDHENVTLNDDQELFVIRTGGGYGAFGYGVCFDESAAFAEAIGRPDLSPSRSDYGTLAQYAQHADLQRAFIQHPRSKETWFGANVPNRLKEALERARGSNRRVIVIYGDRETGIGWGGRPERGTIGRSTGSIRIPLLVKTSHSMGGGALVCSSIVRLQDAASKADLYRHPTYAPAPERPPVVEPAGTAAPRP